MTSRECGWSLGICRKLTLTILPPLITTAIWTVPYGVSAASPLKVPSLYEPDWLDVLLTEEFDDVPLDEDCPDETDILLDVLADLTEADDC